MNVTGKRSGPRSLLKRGPEAARPRTRACIPVLSRTENETYFQVTHAILTAARRWRKLANERVNTTGQTMARWETLFLVALSGPEVTQGDLARLISVEGPTMVRMLDVLAKDGLIARRQSATDRRVTTNRITAKGMRAIRDIMRITDGLRAEVLNSVDGRRLRIFLEVLNEILRRIDEKTEPNALPRAPAPGAPMR